jgi:hypothetical protein
MHRQAHAQARAQAHAQTHRHTDKEEKQRHSQRHKQRQRQTDRNSDNDRVRDRKTGSRRRREKEEGECVNERESGRSESEKADATRHDQNIYLGFLS